MLIRQTLLYLPAQLVGPLFQFIAAVAWTHWLTAEAYGVLALVIAAQELIYFTCFGWWAHATLRYLGEARTGCERKRYLSSESGVLAAMTILQAVATFAALAMIDTPMTPALALSAVAFATTRSLAAYLGDRARAEGRIGAYTGAQLVGPTLGFGLAFAAVAAIEPSPAAALAGFAIAQAIGLYPVARALGVGRRIGWPQRAILARALVFGMPLVGAGAVGWLSVNGVRLVVERFDSLHAVGLVSVGWGLGLRLASVAAMLFTAAAFPLAVQTLQAGRREEALRHLSINGALLFGLLAPMTAGLFFIARPLVELMIAEPFRAVTIAVLPAAMLAGAVRNWRVHFFDQPFLLFERTGLLMGINIAEAALVLVFCALGLVKGGPAGAVWGALAGIVAGAALAAGLAVMRLGLVAPWGAVARLTLATAAMSAGLWAFDWSTLGPRLGLVAAIVCGASVYAAATAALFPDLTRYLLGKAQARRLRPV
ncbi:MAG: hypothetical protein JNK46_10970 [Methylobacteriaceae bacterium]|nr:hypothetical protein [Methylobacteriaceae bacterium]